MTVRPGQLWRAFQLYRSGSFLLGDFAILKADAMGATASPEVEAQLAAVRGWMPRIDLAALRALPDGTFGREYARHMDHNGLAPFEVSPGLEDEVRRNTFVVRYALTHDIFHLLLGFDTSWAGELGVLAFAAAQRYSGHLSLSLTIARVLYRLRDPRHWRAIGQAGRRGWAMGERAPFLLGVRFEEQWDRPLHEVRAACLGDALALAA